MTTWTGTAPTFTAGVNTGNVARLNDLRDAVKAASEAWTSYVPTWTGVSSNPAIGNGAIAAGYSQVGKLVHFRATIVMGTTTTYGTGGWILTLPVAAGAAYAQNHFICSGTAQDSSAGQATPLSINRYTTASTVYAAFGALVTATSPFTWASGDTFSISGSYEAA